jgi:alpha-beta hydrolase superfamily lysophospholipase
MYKYYEINAPGHNVRCKVYYKERAVADNAVIFCTGFAGHKDNRAAEVFAERALSKQKNLIVVVFNWPAHGDDVKKKLDLKDCDTYLDLVISDAKTRFGVQKLYSYTTSFGGYLVLKYISKHGNPFQKIAIRCPGVDMYDVLTRTIIRNDELDRIMKGKDVLVGFDRKIVVSRSLLDELKTNDIRQRDFLEWADSILILHGTADEVVSFDSSKAFAEDNLIEFIPVEKADHRFQNPTHMSLANKYVMEFFGFR